jgi:AraC family transcriptional regulator, regulatory protein of adaptative response / DNA-3-methyladenine glycosylase II
MLPDPDTCYQAMQSRDPRFDGWFFVAVSSTGIYCRPSCPAVTPKRRNVSFFPTAAAAQSAGYRACLRCRPDSSPGSPQWNLRADVSGRAMRLIADGVVDREGVDGLARRLAYSPRQLRRILRAELGAGPLGLARAQRAHTARLLVETTDLPFADVAFAAGFSSLRQFNDTVREVFALTPRDMRRRSRPRAATPARRDPRAGPGFTTTALRLPVRSPFDAHGLLEFFSTRAVAGLEEVQDGTYRRTLTLAHGCAVVELAPREGCVEACLHLEDLRDLAAAATRCRALLDLDADPEAVDAVLGGDLLLADLVGRTPGVRVPGAADGGEAAMRAVLGQRISVAAARSAATRIVAAHGEPLGRSIGLLTHCFPSPEALASADPSSFPVPAARAATLRALARALADGSIDLGAGADRDEARRRLLEIRGIGPWTAEYVAMRALADPDAFPATDLGVLRGLASLGAQADPEAAREISKTWRPWRAYAVQHLWRAPTGSPRLKPRGGSGRGHVVPPEPATTHA